MLVRQRKLSNPHQCEILDERCDIVMPGAAEIPAIQHYCYWKYSI